jgi:hypothetical protein
MMNKLSISILSTLLLILANPSQSAQLEPRDDTLTEEETIGGIGGTGIRLMNRPEIIERPELLERPELDDVRDLMDESLDLEDGLEIDNGFAPDELEKPEPK